MEDQAKRALSQYIVEEILKQPQKVLQPDTAIISSGLIDSFSLVDLALYVEDQFGVHLDDTELNAGSFDTINELVTLIEKRM
ncbi:MAG: acyl carrier protein [Anaerolineales bacterium]|jgi:acyl carrier protein